MNQSLPNLPELESVDAKNTTLFPILALLGSLVLMNISSVFYVYSKYSEFIDMKGHVLVGLIAALLLYILVRILSGYISYKTDENGITMRRSIGSTFISWLDIRDAITLQKKSGHTELILKTDHKTMRICPSGSGMVSSSECLFASVWQHLRRYGCANSIELSPKALTLWSPIPEDVPGELEWGLSPSKISKFVGISGILFFVGAMVALIVVIASTPAKLAVHSALILGFAALIRYVILPETLYSARRAVVCRDGMNIDLLFAKVYLPWSAVTESNWIKDSLVIKSSGLKKEVRIPCKLGDKDSEQLILCIMRYLRTAGTPQALVLPNLVSTDPDVLKQSAYTGEKLGMLKRAFINSLEEPVRTQVRRLYNLQIGMLMAGILLSAVILFGDPSARLAMLLHSGHDTRYFIPGLGIPLFIPLFIASLLLVGVVSDKLCNRLAGSCMAEWKALQKIGEGKSTVVLIRIFTAIAVIGVLGVPVCANWYMRVNDKGIVVNEFCRFREQSYRWQDIQSVAAYQKTYYSHGQPYINTTYQINFVDGLTWMIDPENCIPPKRDEYRKAAEFVAEKSGKKIDYRYVAR